MLFVDAAVVRSVKVSGILKLARVVVILDMRVTHLAPVDVTEPGGVGVSSRLGVQCGLPSLTRMRCVSVQ